MIFDKRDEVVHNLTSVSVLLIKSSMTDLGFFKAMLDGS